MTQHRHIAENAQLLREDFPGRNVCFFGHTHEPRVYEVHGSDVLAIPARGRIDLRNDREYFINAGSVDASRKRAHKLAEFAMFDSTASAVELFSISYNEALTEAKALASGYRLHPLADRLYEVKRRFIGPRQVDSEVA
jgi:predicted phosphodiesterase